MPRVTATALGILGLAAFLAPLAPAQFEGRGMVIGPGSTPIGDMERGAGIRAMGAGIYNYYTAMGDSIEADTWMRLNNYIFTSVREASMRESQRIAARLAKTRQNYNEILDRLVNNPEFKDVRRGGALNAVYLELANPQITESAFRLNPVRLPGENIRTIPFFYAKEDATFSLGRLTARGKWPVGLRGDEFAAERRAYERAVDAALEQQIEGKLSREAIQAIETAVRDVSIKLDVAVGPSRDKVYLEARNYIRRLESTKELFKRREIEQILGEVDKYAGTTVHDLVLFMKRNNLRFGVPDEIGDEQSLYARLHASLEQQLDLVRVPRAESKK
jgi:hypothetical protein